MWTPVSRCQHSRKHLRYGSDLTDAEWAIIAPLLPAPRRTGRPRRWPMRELVNAIFYVLRSGCPWRMVPTNFAPHSTVYRWFLRLRDERVFETTTEAGGPRGYDTGKKVKGRKRHALVDTDGRALVLHAHPASVQDRDGAVLLLKVSRKLFPFIERAFADSAYTAERVMRATVIAIEIVRKQPNQIGFTVHPRRWVVERFFAWINRNRRLAKDFEATIASAEAFLYAASVMLLTRRLARSS
jgi:transposase